jgi:hypothetical protein
MKNLLAKTFGGLNSQYYFRQLAFGLAYPALFYFTMKQGTPQPPVDIMMIVFMAINSILYPYSRYVYESIMNFIVGENVFFVNALVMLFCKMFTMLLCWVLAIFIAPFGLAYLYYYHSK